MPRPALTLHASASSSIETHGYASLGMVAQSIGGGGGVAHEGSTFALSGTVGVDQYVKVTGGVDYGSGAGSVFYNAQANTASASGQIGFGSSNVSNAKITGVNQDKTSNDYGKYSYGTVTYGNSGSSGTVSLGQSTTLGTEYAGGSVTTHGDDSVAIFLQTISGGGGIATMGCSNSTAVNANHYASACWGNTRVEGTLGQVAGFVGGAGTNGVQIKLNEHYSQKDNIGAEGNTGKVLVYSSQVITTHGRRSMGLVTQNITGGGGFFSGPNSGIHSVVMPTQQRITNAPAEGFTDGNHTEINLKTSTITTYGDGAWGLLSQAAVGGGGFFGDSSKDLAFNVKYDLTKSAATDVFTAGQRPSSITDVKFGRYQVAHVNTWNYWPCRNTNTCTMQILAPGEPYKIPGSAGQISWDAGDYIQFTKNGDSQNPYTINQYKSDGTLKTSVGKATIYAMQDGAFFVLGEDGYTAQMYRGDGLITGTQYTIHGISQPTLAQVDTFAAANFFMTPLDVNASLASISSIVNHASLATNNTNTSDTWKTQTAKIKLDNSSIKTYGTNAHGMVIQNLGSVGGAWSSRGEKLTLGVSLQGENNAAAGGWNTPGGKVNLSLDNSSVNVYGPKSRGVVIQTEGAGPVGNGDQAQIRVALTNSSSIYAAQHTALMLVGGTYNKTYASTVTLDATSSITNGLYQTYGGVALDDTDAPYNKWAIYAPTGYTNVTNNGTITGNILLGIVTKGDFTNKGTWHGSTAVIATNSLHNYGVIYAGGQGRSDGLQVDGSLKHYAGAEIHVDVHPADSEGQPHDVITVSGLARMEGEIVTQAKSLLPRDYAFLSAGTLEHSATIRDTHVFDWALSTVDNALVKTPTANFKPAGYGLNRNQSALADYLQRGWDRADGTKAALFGYLHEHDDGDHAGYQQTLNQLSGQVLNSQAIQMKTAFSTSLSDSLSCPMITPQGLKFNQTSCAWAQVLGDLSEQSSNSSNMGFRSRAGGIRLGAQRALDNQWSTGFGLGYAQNYLTASGLTSNGQFFDASVSLQKKVSAWSFGGSLAFAQGWVKNNRLPQLFGNDMAESLAEQHRSDARMSMVGLRFRAAHEFEQKNYYIKPYMDLDVIYSYISGYTESGGALALRANSSSQVSVAITPMVELGTDLITDGKRRIKAYVAAGASFLPNNKVSTQMAFANGSNLGTFDVITNGPDVLGRLNLGIHAYESDNFEVRAEYGLQAGGGYWNQRLSVNLAYRF